MSTGKVTTIRLDADLAADLDAVARATDATAADVIRDALAAHIAALQSDPAFQQRLRQRIQADLHVLERLATAAQEEGG